MKEKSLEEYRRKRDFSQTTEPSGRKTSKDKLVFVVQEHHASHLHYDFRLEIGGVLKSWAVPKGVSDNPKDKRLAIQTEDHPVEYADFEGEIPEGNYGAGTVKTWDKGTYQNLNEKEGKDQSMEDAFKGGHMKFLLNGKKLKGAFALTRTSFKGNKKNWILVKVRNE